MHMLARVVGAVLEDAPYYSGARIRANYVDKKDPARLIFTMHIACPFEAIK